MQQHIPSMVLKFAYQIMMNTSVMCVEDEIADISVNQETDDKFASLFFLKQYVIELAGDSTRKKVKGEVFFPSEFVFHNFGACALLRYILKWIMPKSVFSLFILVNTFFLVAACSVPDHNLESQIGKKSKNA
ncbi:hypothetical protein BDC45DRAFT_537734 [Circinella umbellata]|nr:hypothetical protein BDC45DRAFT_537734 [Circinella umbellata]